MGYAVPGWNMDLGAALLGLFIAFGVKLAVIAMSAVLVRRLFRTAFAEPPRRLWALLPTDLDANLKVLWWSLVLFFVSELVCGVEVYIILRANPITSSLHAITSTLGMGLFAVGLFGFFDRAIFSFATPGRACHMNRICKGCTVAEGLSCKFGPLLALSGAFAAGLGVVPLFLTTSPLTADVTRFILPFPALNTWYDGVVQPWLQHNIASYEPNGVAYTMSHAVMVLEFRILPALLAIVGVWAAWLARTKRERHAIRWLMFALGGIFFIYTEVVLVRALDDILLGGLVHELMEFWFLLATAELLSRAFSADAKPTGIPAR